MTDDQAFSLQKWIDWDVRRADALGRALQRVAAEECRKTESALVRYFAGHVGPELFHGPQTRRRKTKDDK